MIFDHFWWFEITILSSVKWRLGNTNVAQWNYTWNGLAWDGWMDLGTVKYITVTITWLTPCTALCVFGSCSARTDVGELDETSGPENNNNANMGRINEVEPSYNVCMIYGQKCQMDPSMKRILGLHKLRLELFPDHFWFCRILRKVPIKKASELMVRETLNWWWTTSQITVDMDTLWYISWYTKS